MNSKRVRRTTFNLIYVPLLYFNSVLSISPDARIVSLIILIAIAIYLLLNLGIGRLHDMNRTAWWIFGLFVPLLNIALMLVFMFRPGTRGQNRYGPDPREDANVDIQNVDELDEKGSLKEAAKEVKVDGATYPLRRFVARAIDISFVGFVLSILITAGLPFSHEIPSYFLFIFLVILIAFEATMLTTYGTTLGKRLCGITVRGATGQKISFFKALRRTLAVWGVGMGWSLPIVSFLTPIISWVSLKKHGSTKWDRDYGCRLFYKKVSKTAVLLSIFIMYAFLNYSFAPWLNWLSDNNTNEMATKTANFLDDNPLLTIRVEEEPGKFRNKVLWGGNMIRNVYINAPPLAYSFMFPLPPLMVHYAWGNNLTKAIFFLKN